MRSFCLQNKSAVLNESSFGTKWMRMRSNVNDVDECRLDGPRCFILFRPVA